MTFCQRRVSGEHVEYFEEPLGVTVPSGNVTARLPTQSARIARRSGGDDPRPGVTVLDTEHHKGSSAAAAIQGRDAAYCGVGHCDQRDCCSRNRRLQRLN